MNASLFYLLPFFTAALSSYINVRQMSEDERAKYHVEMFTNITYDSAMDDFRSDAFAEVSDAMDNSILQALNLSRFHSLIHHNFEFSLDSIEDYDGQVKGVYRMAYQLLDEPVSAKSDMVEGMVRNASRRLQSEGAGYNATVEFVETQYISRNTLYEVILPTNLTWQATPAERKRLRVYIEWQLYNVVNNNSNYRDIREQENLIIHLREVQQDYDNGDLTVAMVSMYLEEFSYSLEHMDTMLKDFVKALYGGYKGPDIQAEKSRLSEYISEIDAEVSSENSNDYDGDLETEIAISRTVELDTDFTWKKTMERKTNRAYKGIVNTVIDKFNEVLVSKKWRHFMLETWVHYEVIEMKSYTFESEKGRKSQKVRAVVKMWYLREDDGSLLLREGAGEDFSIGYNSSEEDLLSGLFTVIEDEDIDNEDSANVVENKMTNYLEAVQTKVFRDGEMRKRGIYEQQVERNALYLVKFNTRFNWASEYNRPNTYAYRNRVREILEAFYNAVIYNDKWLPLLKQNFIRIVVNDFDRLKREKSSDKTTVHLSIALYEPQPNRLDEHEKQIKKLIEEVMNNDNLQSGDNQDYEYVITGNFLRSSVDDRDSSELDGPSGWGSIIGMILAEVLP